MFVFIYYKWHWENEYCWTCATYTAKLLVLASQVHSNMPGKWLCDDDADEDNKLLSEYADPDI